MRELLPIIWFAVVAIIAIVLMMHVRRKAEAIRAMLQPLATAAGWSEVTAGGFAATGVSGMWRRFPIDITHHNRQKGVPERFIVRVKASNDSELRIKRKFEGMFSNRPIAWFGPPIVDVHQPSAANMWVRGDQALAERIFGDPKTAKAIDENLVERFDEVKIDRSGLRIIRSLGTRGFSNDVTKFEPIARSLIAFAEALVEKMAAY